MRKAIKPRQIINYDAGIVLIDLHQLNVKTTLWQYKSAGINGIRGNLMSTKNRTRRTTRNIRFPNQMIEQINIALEQKGSGNFSVIIEARQFEIVRKEHIHDEAIRMNIPRSSSEQDDIVNSLNYEGIAVIELQFYSLSWQWQTA